jgi:hypothetical protein
LQRVRSFLSEILFFNERGDEKAELEDSEWLFDLAFLADFTVKLSDMNLELHCSDDEYSFILQKQIGANYD